jgi:hypothetical protein
MDHPTLVNPVGSRLLSMPLGQVVFAFFRVELFAREAAHPVGGDEPPNF